MCSAPSLHARMSEGMDNRLPANDNAGLDPFLSAPGVTMKSCRLILRCLLSASMFIFVTGANWMLAADPEYPLTVDSQRQADVPQGIVETRVLKSNVFEGTIREYYVYVPKQLDPDTPAPVMVFQDGHNYVKEDGDYRTTIVLDNLIHKKEIPAMIGIFINPGHKGDELPQDPWKGSNRSFEYDTLSDQYARFLLDEVLPNVAKGNKLTDNPDERAICGISSGGICAWTVAWERPDAFRKVLSHVGSFTNIRGGHNCQTLIRKNQNKPIRVFLQAGSNDLDNDHGNWWLANKEMESSLKYKKYDYKFVGGEGGHNGKHGGQLLPESLRWLWRKE
jgi:enterochelin esterase-like enzyme